MGNVQRSVAMFIRDSTEVFGHFWHFTTHFVFSHRWSQNPFVNTWLSWVIYMSMCYIRMFIKIYLLIVILHNVWCVILSGCGVNSIRVCVVSSVWCGVICVCCDCVCVCVCGCERQTRRELYTYIQMERSGEANLNKYNAKLICYMFIYVYIY